MKKFDTVTIDYNAIESAIQNGERVAVKHLAEKAGVSSILVRNMLNEHYGDRISFIRGRKGGIALAPASGDN